MGESTIVVQRDPGQVFIEVWRNASRGKVVIKHIGEFGKPYSEIVQGGATFQITKPGRRYNQNAAATAKQDIFTNGRLQPVELDPDDPDTASLLENPNHVQEDDISRIFKLKGERLVQRLEQISSVSTMRRLLDLAEEDATQALHSQWRAIHNRLVDLDHDLQHISPKVQAMIENGQDPMIEGDGMPKPVQLGV